MRQEMPDDYLAEIKDLQSKLNMAEYAEESAEDGQKAYWGLYGQFIREKIKNRELAWTIECYKGEEFMEECKKAKELRNKPNV